MKNILKAVRGLSTLAAVAAVGQLVACTTDEGGAETDESEVTSSSEEETTEPEETETAEETSSATESSGDETETGAGGSGGGVPGNTKCANSIALGSATPGIADFDAYDGSSNLATWSFALGGDSATSVYAGTFGYGDRASGSPETFAMVEGSDSTYALGIADSMAMEYGGGMGLWISECLDASAFDGISFWVRGNAPTGDAKLSLLMEETTSNMPATADGAVGTCPSAVEGECVHPSYMFPVTDTWTEIRVPWGATTGGNAAGTPVVADGSNLWQIQFDVGLVWAPDENDVYVSTPAPYELAVDGLTFY